MRTDVKTLLSRLGRNQFRYKEFADRFSELETWPVFEAVIRDPRVFDSPVTNAFPGATPAKPEPAPIATLLSRKYGDAAPQRQPSTGGGDVRSLLARIAAAADKGVI